MSFSCFLYELSKLRFLPASTTKCVFANVYTKATITHSQPVSEILPDAFGEFFGVFGRPGHNALLLALKNGSVFGKPELIKR